METFVTADQHFFHKNIIRYCDRPFKDIGEMHNTIINRWNVTIGIKDMVFVLGDFSFSSPKRTKNIVNNLNGRIYFIPGGHDHWLKKGIFPEGTGIEKNILEIKRDEAYFILCHYPIEEWNRKHYGSIHLHGHSHGNLKNKIENRFDIGVDTNNFYPYNLKEFMK